MINVVLVEPEIPPNTGNIIRLCANTGFKLHLVHPLGFQMQEKRLRRAGLDYHELASVKEHPSLEEFLNQCDVDRVVAFSTKGKTQYTDWQFQASDTMLFGSETKGLPDSFLASLPDEKILRIPMRPDSRSMNLSNSVAIAVYEAWRQLGFELYEDGPEDQD